ncbi:EAL domain-containing protein (putative c-di-GMP-specific phosphodiesterase class I) [Marinobacter pelagius]|uniref:EAL domain-containing protein (Putative c-di-GMP-specific phosphodiesterase class I) n=1 Tax=Marinobacter pelagius TaxID=379482 RepID=A0A366GQM6_9GAMM|nr:GGDEF domain-containing phosphodiesterase [Marinobacter pelagius]RBP30015.1 EAL domain-containing protein (putative c-di-GMP-specific phosphodiesterase class I) [Marinobacter pelagius]
MPGTESTLLYRLFSHRVTFSVFVLTCFLILVIGFSFYEGRNRADISLSGLRLASWSLAQFRDEAKSFDREIILADTRIAQPVKLKIRYDVLWSRFEYLLTSDETYAVRRFNDNVAEIKHLFTRFKALDPIVSGLARNGIAENPLRQLRNNWRPIHTGINQLVIDNLIGGESGNLTQQFDHDLNQVSRIRTLLLVMLSAGLVYFLFALIYLKKQFKTDPLTGLPNRHFLRQRRAVTENDLYLVCEIKSFQTLQTDHGDSETDALIRESARKLARCISETDTLVHLSYGEFVIIRRDTSTDPARAAQKILDRSSFDWKTEHSTVPIQFAMGADPGNPELSENRSWRIRHTNALRALGHSLNKGADLTIADDNLISEYQFKRKVLRELVHFFRGHTFSDLSLSLVYQPIVRVDRNKTIAGAEVLLRCRLGDGTSVPPNIIVDICEHHQLGKVFGEWLLKQIASEASQICSVLRFDGFLSINLNPSLISSELPELLETTVLSAGLKPDNICLEITEDNACIEFESTVPILQELKALGVNLALDDFGTGYSSLEYLQKLQIDKLKIDRNFVNRIESNRASEHFLRGIIDITHLLSVETVIEGVENKMQWDIVARNKADFVQGYYAYKPMDFTSFLSCLVSEMTDTTAHQEVSLRSTYLMK